MKIFYRSSILFFALTTFNSFSQVMIGEPVESKKSDTLVKLKNELEPKREKDGSTEVYFGPTWNKSNRKLVINGDLYGDELGLRGEEVALSTWSYNLGFRNYLHKNIALEAGISYMTNGESYSFDDGDSSFNYQTTYSYICMPIKLLYSYGEDIRFMAGAGLIPEMFDRYRQEQQWENGVGEKSKNTVKTQNNYNSFLMSATVCAGVQLRYSNSFSIYLMPEYRWQLNSSNLKTNPYRHYARVAGINFGFVYLF